MSSKTYNLLDGKWYCLNYFHCYNITLVKKNLSNLGMSAQPAVEKSLQLMKSKVKGAGGAICISASGEAAFSFTTERMAWAVAKTDVVTWGLDPEETNSEKLV